MGYRRAADRRGAGGRAVIWVLVAIGIVVFGLAAVAVSRRRTPDGVATFQRQIDALSPEARRPVVRRLEDVVKNEPPNSESRGDGSNAPDPGESRRDGRLDGA